MDDKKSLLEQKPDYLVCTCFGVMYSDIVNEIVDGADSFDALQETLFVGTGCSSCVAEVKGILQEQSKK
jgi:assimilatory nitrate reductase catalytic subunit